DLVVRQLVDVAHHRRSFRRAARRARSDSSAATSFFNVSIAARSRAMARSISESRRPARLASLKGISANRLFGARGFHLRGELADALRQLAQVASSDVIR